MPETDSAKRHEKICIDDLARVFSNVRATMHSALPNACSEFSQAANISKESTKKMGVDFFKECKKYFENGNTREGLHYASLAIEAARYDKKPGLVCLETLKLVRDQGLWKSLDNLATKAIALYPDNSPLINYCANRMLSRNKILPALDLLIEHHKAGHGNDRTIITLADAYIKAGQEDIGVSILRSLCEQKPEDQFAAELLHKTLG